MQKARKPPLVAGVEVARAAAARAGGTSMERRGTPRSTDGHTVPGRTTGQSDAGLMAPAITRRRPHGSPRKPVLRGADIRGEGEHRPPDDGDAGLLRRT